MFQTILGIGLSCLAIMLVSLCGAFFLHKRLHDWMEKSMTYLLSFSAGIFFIIGFNIALEVFEESSLLLSIGSIGLGALIAFLIERIIPDCYHHHDECHEHHSRPMAYRMLLGDSLHNITDGFLLAPAFVADFRLGLLVAASVFIHEFVQGISEFFVLKEAGYTTSQALIRNVITNSTVFIGAILGLFLAQSASIMSPLLGIAAGLLLYMFTMDMLPRSIRASQEQKKYVRYFLMMLLGVLLILGLAALTGQGQLEEEILQLIQ
ncbi:MAG: ZIP family metal transporter [Patescibacteria group bacterium]